jgi:hypothetical protein
MAIFPPASKEHIGAANMAGARIQPRRAKNTAKRAGAETDRQDCARWRRLIGHILQLVKASSCDPACAPDRVSYGLGMPASKRPTSEDAAIARRSLLEGLGGDKDIFEVSSRVCGPADCGCNGSDGGPLVDSGNS